MDLPGTAGQNARGGRPRRRDGRNRGRGGHNQGPGGHAGAQGGMQAAPIEELAGHNIGGVIFRDLNARGQNGRGRGGDARGQHGRGRGAEGRGRRGRGGGGEARRQHGHGRDGEAAGQHGRGRGGIRGGHGGNRRGGGDNNRNDRSRGPILGYQRLLELSMMESDKVIFEVVRSKEPLKNLLQKSNVKPDWVKLLMIIYSKVCESTMRTNVFDVMSLLPGSKLIKDRLREILQELPLHDDIIERKQQFVESVLSLFERFNEMFPSSAGDLPIADLMLIVGRLEFENRAELLARVTELVTTRERILEESMRKLQLKSKRHIGAEGPPPEDYRTLSVEPTFEDIKPDKDPYLRPIKAEGQYSDGEEYLDIQFRLLKEDLIAPLREGIEEITLGLSRADKKQNIRVYTGVRIIAPHISYGGIIHRIQFDMTHLQRVPWHHTRRLIFGSLLCFSSDNFQTFFFATVANREVKDLMKGELDVRFVGGLGNELINVTIQDNFDMAESPSFFEAYRHVLSALQNINPGSVPFADYIISASSDAGYPQYLRRQESILYDLSGCLTKPGATCKTSLSKIPDWEHKSVLNQSQLLAVQKALSREFVVIQGPPGTGKTFVGLRIAHALLENESIWESGNGSHVLVVCYTNHALDQFIEGLLQMGHDDIVRVGARCKSELVEQYNLRNKKGETKRKQRNRGAADQDLQQIYRAKGNVLRERYGIKDGITDASKRLEKVQRDALSGKILPLAILSKYLPDRLRNWFDNLDHVSRQARIPFLEIFLELFPVPLEVIGDIRRETVALQEEIVNQNSDIARPNLHQGEDDGSDDDQFIGIEGEAEELLDRWVIDEDQYRPLEDHGFDRNNQIVEEEEPDFVLVDSEGFTTVAPKRAARRFRARTNLLNTAPMTSEEVNQITDPMRLQIQQRWMLYAYLIGKFMEERKHAVVRLGQEYEQLSEQIKELDGGEDEVYMRRSKIIAMTTTGAARYRDVLDRIKPKIIIVEEAAEVLEAHVITSLTDGAEHLILIGDHKQLKPKPSVYNLAKRYQLELSLFERMISNGMDCHRLDIQHRMRPDIARLLRDIYPKLEDHPSVTEYPDIHGVSSNLFFIDHRFPERTDGELKSKSNVHEAEYIAALCWYLLLQGYPPEKITVLTLYTGQLLTLKNLMPKTRFQGVRLTAVDNFQGEENDIILLSLVRSNKEGSIGFSGEENRICVSLSRAKHGLFVIGNFALLASQSQSWANIVEGMRAKNQIGASLGLFCRNHPERSIEAVSADDFKKAPEGGCKEPCNFRLKCGHVCQKACHPVDQEHIEYKCQKPCQKLLCSDTNHRCRKRCHFGTSCGPCMNKVPKIVPVCGHEQQIPCSMDPASFSCTFMVQNSLDCGHMVDVQCHVTDFRDIVCRVRCEALLECGHQCAGTCSKCHQGRLHIRCNHPCKRSLVCSHLCKEPCSKECPPCQTKCNNTCGHSKCAKLCGEECAPCMEKCAWKCSHKQCSMLCHELCDRKPCNKPCPHKINKCKHPCIGICGEKCPKVCRICNKEEVEEIFFGDEDEEGARFIQLIDCPHFFEVNGLDTWMQTEQEGENASSIGMKLCPKCKVPIRKCYRYGNIIKKQQKDINAVKKILIDQRKQLADDLRPRLQSLLDDVQRIRPSAFDMEALRRSTTNLFFRGKMQDQSNKAYYKLIKDGIVEKHSNLDSSLETIIESQVELLERVIMLLQELNSMEKEKRYAAPKEINQILSCLCALTKVCLENNITVQQVQDADLEMRRLTLFHGVVMTANDKQKTKFAEGHLEIINGYLNRLRNGKKLDQKMMDCMRNVLAEIRKKAGMGELTKEEIKMIVKAMNFAAGHWYKCPNGHVYAIGDCGGANQEAKCPECNATIGGTMHRLAAGNQHAGEFDGSRYAAWSEGNNLENFDPLEFRD